MFKILFLTMVLFGYSSPISGWRLPFEQQPILVRPYLQPSSDYSAGHRGVDYAVAIGQKLVAPADGVVSFAGRLVNRGVISIKHSGTLVSELEPACSSVAVGQSVMAGQVIGRVCAAEPSYIQHCPKQTCLHFSVRQDGRYLSPLVFIGGLNPSRLLPYSQ